jgi:hypothetical protein
MTFGEMILALLSGIIAGITIAFLEIIYKIIIKK